MHSLLESIQADLVEALKAHDDIRTGTLRLLLSAVHNREIEKRAQPGSLTDDEVCEVLAREAKKRKESIQLFMNGGRNDLAEKETAELSILKAYLPAELSEAEVRAAVSKAIEAMRPAGEKDFGKVMGYAMKELKGRADADLVGRLIREALGAL